MFKSLFKRKDKVLKHQIEFCISNLSFGSADAYDELIQREDVVIEESGCTSNCETCDSCLFAVVNSEVVTAETADELLQRIEEKMKENPLMD
ncbi:DUF1450 domain-containing protein [Lysinibacillus sp. KU-BSD001]|uniref:DUF1450 domain-containing protein n=1 Tax=Lysinibacillus sp. KU-BSD001 TaxID=3141328 RepID=UPI0036E41DA4